MYKEVWCTCEVVVLLIKPIVKFNKIQIHLILFNTFDKLVAKFYKFALKCIRFSPTFMKQFIRQAIFIRWFEQNSFDNSRNIHSMIRTKSFDNSRNIHSMIRTKSFDNSSDIIRWCTWPVFHIRIEGLATVFTKWRNKLNGSLWRLACSICCEIDSEEVTYPIAARVFNGVEIALSVILVEGVDRSNTTHKLLIVWYVTL